MLTAPDAYIIALLLGCAFLLSAWFLLPLFIVAIFVNATEGFRR